MAATSARINPTVLRWMRERSGLAADKAATAAGVRLEQLTAWEAGIGEPPTFRQAQKLAHALHAPFGYLFLSKAPVEQLPLPDLRTVADAPPPASPSVNLLDTVRQSLRRQEWYIEYLREQEQEPLPFIGRFTSDADVAPVAADIRAVLGVDVEHGQRTWEIYFKHLIEAAERAGIMVMRSGIVGSNTHRVLDVGEFRGFAISDRLAPLVFINLADAPTARLFTLIHELAHLWIGSSGISNLNPRNNRKEEIFCNAVAGEFLAPRDTFIGLWQAIEAELGAKVAEIGQRFHVSSLVVMRRAYDLQLVNYETYFQHYQAELQAYRDRDGGGGNYYRTAGAKNSIRFARAVIAEAFSGKLLLRDAGELLGMQPSKLKQFAETLRA